MFDQLDFERRYYDLITEDVNHIFAELIKTGNDNIRQDGLRILREIMASLHAITEESVMQTVYGLLTNKEKN